MSVNLLANSATVAQLVEQRIRNAWVGGSNPSGGSTHHQSLINSSKHFILTVLRFAIFLVSLQYLLVV